MNLYITCAASALLLTGLVGLSWAGKKERWDVASWSVGLVVVGFGGLDYVAGGKNVAAVIAWFSDPAWLVALLVLGVLVAIFVGYRLTLAIVYAISRAWHQGAQDAQINPRKRSV